MRPLDTPRDGRSSGIDRVASLGVAFGFSVGLGVATVTVPLLALASGYDAAAVGILVATSAASRSAAGWSCPGFSPGCRTGA